MSSVLFTPLETNNILL